MVFSQYSLIQSQIDKIKEKMFSTTTCDPYKFISPSAYATAWLAMIPDPHQPLQPMFKSCLEWVLYNQKEEGFWGECDAHGVPNIECLPATLACIVALKKWNIATGCIEKGLAFLHANTEKFVREMNHGCPRWFTIVFPAMVELAHTIGVELVFQHSSGGVMSELFNKRQQILEQEKVVDKCQNPPLLAYLEALPASYEIDQDEIINHLISNDGSLFQSPSATASAFMITGNKQCLAYLRSLVERCDNGVPPTYPMDEDLINLCMVNHFQRLGLAEYFVQETEKVLEKFYRNYLSKKSWPKPRNLVAAQILRDSLAFRLLRMHGYDVSPDSFCWFLHRKDIRDQIENNHDYFSSPMLNVYRATDLMFSAEHDLQEARSFSKKLLEKTVSVGTRDVQTHDAAPSNLRRVIEHELSLPWSARLDHMEHRMWIEENDSNFLWMGKASSHRLSCPYNEELLGLAKQNFEFRQSIYKNELEELKRWSKDMGLSDMGFGREKTTYCYFAVAASSSLPPDSSIRTMVAKSAIVITVADDFYDMEGSLIELKALTNAVQRWDAKGLSGHGKVIFDALDNLVTEIAAKYFQQEGLDITCKLRDIWYGTFLSWFTESTWGKKGCMPSMDVYLETAMISIAIHVIVLQASCFLNPTLANSKLRPARFENMTKLLMLMARLLNDTQSYQKEKEEGTVNFVLLYLKENPEADIEESIAFVRKILDEMQKELLQHVLIDGLSDLPKQCKYLHLSSLKVFQMFFNSANRYDSNTEMLQDISKAIYVPVEVGNNKKPLKPVPLFSGTKINEDSKIRNALFNGPSKYYTRRITFATQRVSWPASSYHGHGKMFVPPKYGFCFT